MNENEIITEITFEEEFSCLEKDVKDFFGNYENESGGEDCIEVCLIRNGYRAAKKAREEINRQKAEIKALQKAIKVQDIMIEQQDYKIKKAETEARKEFAERVVSQYAYKLYEQNGKPTSDRAILVSDMNNLLAEMESGRR